jgi:hypothetical protein
MSSSNRSTNRLSDYVIAVTGEAQRLDLSIRRIGDIRTTRIA